MGTTAAASAGHSQVSEMKDLVGLLTFGYSFELPAKKLIAFRNGIDPFFPNASFFLKLRWELNDNPPDVF
jgi:hypothetical protein